MRRKLWILASAAVLSFSMAGGIAAEEPETEITVENPAAETETETEAETNETDAWYVPEVKTDISRGNNSEREKKNEDGKVHSYLTGELIDEEKAYKRPFALMINNIINAMPQAGIANADVVYEAPVEGSITRLLAIFQDMEGMEKVGPIRSCRDYYIDYAMEYDAIYVHYGQAVYAYELLNSDMVNNISGLQYQEAKGELNGYAGEDSFYRTSDRKAPHNVYTSYERLMKAVEKKDYSLELDDDYTGHFLFAKDGEEITYSDAAEDTIEPSANFSNHPYFTYDEDSKKYLRFQYGDKQIDQLTGEQLAYDNVIIQYSEIAPYDENGYLNINTNSGGTAVIYTRGTYTTAEWKKTSDWGPIRYYDEDGNEIAINQGKTWITIVDADEY